MCSEKIDNNQLKSPLLYRRWNVSLLGSGGSSRLESVGEDDELFVENGVRSNEMVEKPPPGRRKHSLPQPLDIFGARQVSNSLLTLLFI